MNTNWIIAELDFNLWIIFIISQYCEPNSSKKTAVLFLVSILLLLLLLIHHRHIFSVEPTTAIHSWERTKSARRLRERKQRDKESKSNVHIYIGKKETESIGKSSHTWVSTVTHKSQIDLIFRLSSFSWHYYFIDNVFIVVGGRRGVNNIFVKVISFAWISSSRIIDVYAIVREQIASGDRIWFSNDSYYNCYLSIAHWFSIQISTHRNWICSFIHSFGSFVRSFGSFACLLSYIRLLIYSFIHVCVFIIFSVCHFNNVHVLHSS